MWLSDNNFAFMNNRWEYRNAYVGEVKESGFPGDDAGVAWRHGNGAPDEGVANAVYFDGHAAAVRRGEFGRVPDDIDQVSRNVLRFWGPVGPDRNPVENVIDTRR